MTNPTANSGEGQGAGSGQGAGGGGVGGGPSTGPKQPHEVKLPPFDTVFRKQDESNVEYRSGGASDSSSGGDTTESSH